MTQLTPFADSSAHVSFIQHIFMKPFPVPSSVLRPGVSQNRLTVCGSKHLCVLVSSRELSPAQTSPRNSEFTEPRPHSASLLDIMPPNRHLTGICPDPDAKPTPPTALSTSTEAPPFFPLLKFFLESSMPSASVCLGNHSTSCFFVFVFVFVWPCHMPWRDLSSPTRDGTLAPCSGSSES